MLETSSAGLRGQSGGPIFDRDGTIWGIQSSTTHYELGFQAKVADQVEHQFLNVGRAVDAQTVRAFLDKHGIAYNN